MPKADEALRVTVNVFVQGDRALVGAPVAIPAISKDAPLTRENLEGMIKSAALRSVSQGGMNEADYELARKNLNAAHLRNVARKEAEAAAQEEGA